MCSKKQDSQPQCHQALQVAYSQVLWPAPNTAACRRHLAARVVLAVGPVQIAAAAVVVCVHQLVRQRVRHLLLAAEVVVADDHLRARQSQAWAGLQERPAPQAVCKANRLGLLLPVKAGRSCWSQQSCRRGVGQVAVRACALLERRRRDVCLPRTPSGGRKPPPTCTSHFSTRKNLRLTLHPACTVACSVSRSWTRSGKRHARLHQAGDTPLPSFPP